MLILSRKKTFLFSLLVDKNLSLIIDKNLCIINASGLSQNYNKLFSNKLSLILSNSAKNVISINKNTDIAIKTSINNLTSILYFFNKNSLLQYKQLIDIICYDKPENFCRFTIHYLLHSLNYNANILISVKVAELTAIPTATNIFLSANWLEREVWDLFGVFFRRNSKLSRILTDYGFTGHPLRKDFPVTGFQEFSYSYLEHRVLSSSVELPQELREWQQLKC